MDGLTVRALAVSEWGLFRDLRLMALKDAPGAFATSYTQVAQRTPETWQSLVRGPTNKIFGLFDGQHLVGITGAFAWPDDPQAKPRRSSCPTLCRRIVAAASRACSMRQPSTGRVRILASGVSSLGCAPAMPPRDVPANATASCGSERQRAPGLMAQPRMRSSTNCGFEPSVLTAARSWRCARSRPTCRAPAPSTSRRLRRRPAAARRRKS